MKRRYYMLDALRGLTILSMTGYHALWDVRYFLGNHAATGASGWDYLWQQSICWIFILLSGFCWPLGSRQLKRSLQVFAAGLLVTGITLIFLPNECIIFGILTFLGTAGLLLTAGKYLAGRWDLSEVPHKVRALVYLLLFLLFRNISSGTLGFEGLRFIDLPAALYQNHITAFLGFPPGDFVSQDYFPLFPWLFLYMTGYEMQYFLMSEKVTELFISIRIRPLEWMGRHSLILYLLHQPFLYGVIWLISRS